MTASAPGKVILMGEHAAVYGRPALLAALDRRLTARLSALEDSTLDTSAEDGTVDLALGDLGHRENVSWIAARDHARAVAHRWRTFIRAPSTEAFRQVAGKDPAPNAAHLIKVAVGEAVSYLEARGSWPGHPGRARLEIHSQIPLGSGFGSSAAAAAVILAAVLAFFGVEASEDELHRLSLEVERRQHGRPSGLDSAVVLRGGLLWGRRLPDGEMSLEPLPVGAGTFRGFSILDTGAPTGSTGEVVARVAELRDRDRESFDGLLEAMESETLGLRRQITDPRPSPEALISHIRHFERCLEALGVVPEVVQDAIRAIEAAGGAAKVSGAGSLAGPGAGSLLVYRPPGAGGEDLPNPAGFQPLDGRLGGDGLTVSITETSEETA